MLPFGFLAFSPCLVCWAWNASNVSIKLSGHGNVKRWRDDLLEPHRPHPLSPIDFGQPLDVQVGLNVRHLLDVNVIGRYISLAVWLRVRWLDPSLLYDFDDVPENWNSTIDYIPLKFGDIWAPVDISCVTHVGSTVDHFDQQGFYLYDRNFSNKNKFNVHWARQGKMSSKCQLKLQNFPFDVQNCSLRIESWMYPTCYMRLRGMTPVVETTELVSGTSQYDIDFDITDSATKYEVLNTEWPSVNFNIILTRKPHYYIQYALLPMGLMVILTNVVPWVPVEYGIERIVFCVTLLLTAMASIIFTADKRPVSGVETWLDRWQAWCIVFTIIPTVESAIVTFFQKMLDRVNASTNLMEEGGRRTIKHSISDKTMSIISTLAPVSRKGLLPSDLDWVFRVGMPVWQTIVSYRLLGDENINASMYRAFFEISFLSIFGLTLLTAFLLLGSASLIFNIFWCVQSRFHTDSKPSLGLDRLSSRSVLTSHESADLLSGSVLTSYENAALDSLSLYEHADRHPNVQAEDAGQRKEGSPIIVWV